MIELDRNSDVTAQVFDHMCARIARGEWPANSSLPSVRQLAREYGVSVTTIQRTVAKLEARQLVETSPGRKSIVKARQSRVVSGAVTPGSHIAIVREVSRLDDTTKSARGWGSEINAAIDAVLHHRGLRPVGTFYRMGDADASIPLAEQFDQLGEKLAGAIVFPSHAHHELPHFIEQRGLPFVSINRTDPASFYNFVSVDYVDAGRRIGRCYADMGKYRVLMLGEQFSLSMSWNEICTGLVQSMLEAGAPLEQIGFARCEGHVEEVGYAATSKYLDANIQPDVIVAAGDYLALGAMRACHERKLAIPGDVQVIGGAGLNVSEYFTPPLSVIGQPHARIGREAASMLLEMLDTGATWLPGQLLSSPLILRESTDVPPHHAAMLQHLPIDSSSATTSKETTK